MNQKLMVVLIISILLAGIAAVLVIHSFSISENKKYCFSPVCPVHKVIICSNVANVIISKGSTPKLIIHLMAKGIFLSSKIFSVSYKESNGALIVKVKQCPLVFFFNSRICSYICITLPSPLLDSISISLGNGNVNIENVSSTQVKIYDGNGNIGLMGGDFTSLTLSDINGNIELISANSTNLCVSDSNGNVEIEGSSTSTLHVNDLNGNIELQCDNFSNGNVKTSNGCITLNNALGNYLKACTSNGNINVMVSKYFKLVYYLASSNGNIHVTALPSIRIVTNSGVKYSPPVIYASTANGSLCTSSI
ncbi:DUF4097 family beta strand repeat-containing protein [Acidianus sp. HS-5]|uniref:DUF4097 family beta strand repeat-containing protein n=1 Tax=Acidianus sp. HS-5 TaxID=2886040 RepID=UPI001F421B86|nr:DUF4097 family beta strand repeat-containing protein [Acidianus sp. HS-5]